MSKREVAITLAAALALLAWEASGLDLIVSGWFGGSAGFTWRSHWFTQRVLYDGGRVLAWGVLAVLVVDALRPLWPGPTRRERALGLGLTLLAALAIPALKRVSATSCPWDLALYGGSAPYVPHWLPGVSDGGPGHCFPSGHAVAAFAFFGAALAWRRASPRAARSALAVILVAGLVFGAVQLVRGAHFVSHTLWSGWLSWTIAAVGWAIANRSRRVGPAAAAAAATATAAAS
jgi:membrane-associated PAP2 superfamily phosphatase